MKIRVYADNASTTKLCDEALEAMLPYLSEKYENPSSTYSFGVSVRTEIEKARRELLNYLCADIYHDNLIYTSGGAEADSLAIMGVMEKNCNRGKHIITTAIEHHAILRACKALEDKGCRVTYIRPGENGVVELSEIEKNICPDTVMISVMYINNETGAIQPVKEIGELCKRKGIVFHIDAVQAFGKVETDVSKLNCDLLSVSAHKFHGPKGVGFLYVKGGVNLSPVIFGGTQEKGLRGGTENVAGIMGMYVAAKKALMERKDAYEKLKRLNLELKSGIINSIEGIKINGDTKDGYPGILNVSVFGVEGQTLLISLDMKGILASTGSACAIGLSEPSHVLTAMGLSEEEAKSSVRFSLDSENTSEDVIAIIEALKDSVDYLRRIGGVNG